LFGTGEQAAPHVNGETEARILAHEVMYQQPSGGDIRLCIFLRHWRRFLESDFDSQTKESVCLPGKGPQPNHPKPFSLRVEA
jgi:hypothetical protein